MGGTDATSPLLGFLIATVVFAVSFATVVEVSVQRGEEVALPEPADRQIAASTLADVLLSTPGKGWYSTGAACASARLNDSAWSPERVSRLGLAEERCALADDPRSRVSNLSFEKLQNLYRAGFQSDAADDAVDYAEARRSLTLDEAGLNFHVRSWPLLPSIGQMLAGGYKDPHLRPLYVGDYEEDRGGGSPVYLVQHSAGVADGSAAATLWVNVTNNGTTSTAFSVTFEVKTKQSIITEMHTGLVAAGATHNVTLVVNKTAGWTWKSDAEKEYAYTIRDPSRTVGEGTVSMSALTMTHAETRRVLTAESAQLRWIRDGTQANVSIDYDALTGEGKSNVDYTTWSIEILNSADTVVDSAASGDLEASGGTETFTVSATGTFRARLYGAAGWVAQTDSFEVVDTEIDRFNPGGAEGDWVPQQAAKVESSFVQSLSSKFNRSVMDDEFDHADLPYAAGGDVYPDDNKALADWLPGALLVNGQRGQGTTAVYNVLFIGSDVDHRTLTSANIKDPISDWVQAGGTLIVFGSDGQKVEWLEPLFHVGLESAGGGLSVPDQKHPLLNTPNRLDPAAYDSQGNAWDFKQDQDADFFTHIVLSGPDDILAASDPGAFGDGRVILTSWRPYDLTYGDPPPECTPGQLTAGCPGLQLVDNLITMAYRGLYLDYGPPIPPNVAQGVQSRIGTVFHPELGALVEVYFLVYVFG